jgi:hypothetical protein
MVAYARRKLLGGERQAVFHCWNRCVRRAFLCGCDRQTGKDYSHRRDWILEREEQLAGLFAIDLEFRAELSNHCTWCSARCRGWPSGGRPKR